MLLGTHNQPIHYEDSSNLCARCGCLGHNLRYWTQSSILYSSTQPTTLATNNTTTTSTQSPWKTASYPRSPKTTKQAQITTAQAHPTQQQYAQDTTTHTNGPHANKKSVNPIALNNGFAFIPNDSLLHTECPTITPLSPNTPNRHHSSSSLLLQTNHTTPMPPHPCEDSSDFTFTSPKNKINTPPLHPIDHIAQ